MHIKPEGKAHYYDPVNGYPCHQVPYADAKRADEMRSTTLADARKLGLVPGVTGICSEWARPGLEAWKLSQMAEAAATCPRLPDEPDTSWWRRVATDGREAAMVAAEKGTRIHKAIARWLAGEAPLSAGDLDICGVVNNYQKWHAQNITEVKKSECSFASHRGYGGTVVLVARYRGEISVIDFKTKNTKQGGKIIAPDDWGLQLVAYAEGLDLFGVNLINVILSRSESGRIEVKIWDNHQELLALFNCCLCLWRRRNRYDPRETLSTKGVR